MPKAKLLPIDQWFDEHYRESVRTGHELNLVLAAYAAYKQEFTVSDPAADRVDSRPGTGEQ